MFRSGIGAAVSQLNRRGSSERFRRSDTAFRRRANPENSPHSIDPWLRSTAMSNCLERFRWCNRWNSYSARKAPQFNAPAKLYWGWEEVFEPLQPLPTMLGTSQQGLHGRSRLPIPREWRPATHSWLRCGYVPTPARAAKRRASRTLARSPASLWRDFLRHSECTDLSTRHFQPSW
jgi:hypothetical protein